MHRGPADRRASTTPPSPTGTPPWWLGRAEVKEQYPQDVDEPTFRHIITSLEPLFVEVFDDRLIDDTVPDPEYRRILREFQMSSFLVVPLVAGGKGIGIITLVGCHGRHIDPDDVGLAVDLGRRAGPPSRRSASTRSARDNRSSRAACFPPACPTSPASPCQRTTDLRHRGPRDRRRLLRRVPHRADRWWVVLGDVCGKGPAAAALTAAVRYTVRAVAPDSDDAAAVSAG